MPLEINLTNFAPTVAKLFDTSMPEEASPAIEWIVNIIKEKAGGSVKKGLLVHVDAVPAFLIQESPNLFAPIYSRAPFSIPMRAVMPSITPVCFAAMFSGAAPAENGVDHYVKPILDHDCIQPSLKVPSLMGVLAAHGLRVAVVTCQNGCIASMLAKEPIDLYIVSGDDDVAMADKAMELILSDECDVLFLYQLSYDYKMHETGPRSAQAINALEGCIARFAALSDAAKEHWKKDPSLIVFNSDHGARTTADGHGTHGEDTPDEMNTLCFWGPNPAHKNDE